jgi:hypothetical protein
MRDRSDPTILFGLLTLLCCVGTAAAWQAHHTNEARMTSYYGDPACRTQLTPDDERAAAAHATATACSIDRATVADHWLHRHKGGADYRAAFTTNDGVTDSAELKTRAAHASWNALRNGGTVLVERFTDPTAHTRRHVTAVRALGAPTVTAWNPDQRDRNANAGMIALGILSAVFGVGYVWALGKRRARLEA